MVTFGDISVPVTLLELESAMSTPGTYQEDERNPAPSLDPLTSALELQPASIADVKECHVVVQKLPYPAYLCDRSGHSRYRAVGLYGCAAKVI